MVAMLLLFFCCFNALDTLKGSRSGWCLCNSTAELEASSLTRGAECAFYVYMDYYCFGLGVISYAFQIAPKTAALELKTSQSYRIAMI